MKRTAMVRACVVLCIVSVAGCVTTKTTETIVSGNMKKVTPVTSRGTYRSSDGSREYVAYRPATFPVKHEERALVVMLHGCMQTADDFATGTRMNSVADSGAFLVLYPEQSASAHPQKCWNWYAPEQYSRGKGEAALLAGMIDSVAKAEGVMPQHVALVGMSAGAAMAANLFVAYPERYAALALHSGIPALAASDMPASLAAMRDGASGGATLGARAIAAMGARVKPVSVLVLHGDADTTVAVANLRATAEQFRAVNAAVPGGKAIVEEALLPGVGHAWSGGAAEGSYTAPAGRNASVIVAGFLRRVGVIQ